MGSRRKSAFACVKRADAAHEACEMPKASVDLANCKTDAPAAKKHFAGPTTTIEEPTCSAGLFAKSPRDAALLSRGRAALWTSQTANQMQAATCSRSSMASSYLISAVSHPMMPPPDLSFANNSEHSERSESCMGAKRHLTCQQACRSSAALPAPAAHPRVKSFSARSILKRQRDAEREELKLQRARARIALRQEREQQKQEQKRQRERLKEELRQERLESLVAMAKYPIADACLLIEEEGELKGKAHTDLPAPDGERTQVYEEVGEELEDAALGILDFLSVFGMSLFGVRIEESVFLKMLSADGLTASEQELFFRLMLAALHGRQRHFRAQSFTGSQTAHAENENADSSAESAAVAHLCNILLSEAEDGTMQATTSATLVGPGSAERPIWSLLTPVTWPALLRCLIISLPWEAYKPSHGDHVEERWKRELAEVLSSHVDRMPAHLKIRSLSLLCEEACASPGMHDLIDLRLEKQAALKRQRLEQNEVDRKKKAELQGAMAARRLKLASEEINKSQNPSDCADDCEQERSQAMLRLLEEQTNSQHELLELEHGRVEREETFSKAIEEVRVRIEPLGKDRHGREYFVSPGRRNEVMAVDCNNGNAKRVSYRTAQQLEELHKWLNEKSITELPLRRALTLRMPTLLLASKEREAISAAETAVIGLDFDAAPPGHDGLMQVAYAGSNGGQGAGRLPPFLLRVRSLTKRFCTAAGMEWGKEGLEECRVHLLSLEETCRWCYLAGKMCTKTEKVLQDVQWSRIEQTARDWVHQRKLWRQRVEGAENASALAREVLALARVLAALSLSPADGEKTAYFSPDPQDRDCVAVCSNEKENLPDFWASESEASTWRLLVEGRGGVSGINVSSVALAVLVLGDRAGSHIRTLIAYRVGMLGWRLRVKCWTEDVGRSDWHTCTIRRVRVPLLSTSVAKNPPGASKGSLRRRYVTRGTSRTQLEEVAETTERMQEMLSIEHQVKWDAAEVVFCFSMACAYDGVVGCVLGLKPHLLTFLHIMVLLLTWCARGGFLSSPGGRMAPVARGRISSLETTRLVGCAGRNGIQSDNVRW